MGDEATIAPFWWLKRLGPLAVVVPLAWLAIHLALGHRVAAREAAIIDGWARAGLATPADAERQVGVAPATPGNAAFLLERAMAALPAQTPRQWELELTTADTTAELWALFAGGVWEANHAAAYALVRTARETTNPADADWGQDTPHFGNIGSNRFGDARDLANRLRYAALTAHQRGDIASTVSFSRDVLAIAESLPALERSTISVLVAIGIDALATDTLRNALLLTPPLLDADATADAWRAARPEVEAAIVRLLDPAFERSLHESIWRNEGLWLVGDEKPFIEWGTGQPVVDWITAPARRSLRLDEAEAYDRLRVAAEAADGPLDLLLTARRNELAGFRPDHTGTSVAGKLASSDLIPDDDSGSRPMIAQLRALAERRMTAILLAARLYELDHAGALPPTLGALVPTYLPRVPIDPFSPAGDPIRHVPAGPMPFVYSVGENLADDGGSVVPTDEEDLRRAKSGSMNEFELPDLIRPLRPPPVEGVTPWGYPFDRGADPR